MLYFQDCIVYASAFSDEEEEKEEEKEEEEEKKEEEEKNEDIPAISPEDEEEGAMDDATSSAPPESISEEPDQIDELSSQDPTGMQDQPLPGSEEREGQIKTDEEKKEDDAEKKEGRIDSPEAGAFGRERKTSSSQGTGVYFYQGKKQQQWCNRPLTP